MNDLEAQLQAKSTAPRVTPADIEAEITSESYFTAAEGVRGASAGRPGESLLPEYVTYPGSPLSLLTFCVLVLKNGFTVTGTSACASPANFDAEIGRRVARADAVFKVWPLLGFRLRDQLAAEPPKDVASTPSTTVNGYDFTEGGRFTFKAWSDQPVGGTLDAPVRRMSDQAIVQTVAGYLDQGEHTALVAWLTGPSGLDRAALLRAADACGMTTATRELLDDLEQRHPSLAAWGAGA